MFVFSYIYTSQSTAETRLWCDGIYNNYVIANCLQSAPVKEFWKLVWTKEYWHVFIGHGVYVCVCVCVCVLNHVMEWKKWYPNSTFFDVLADCTFVTVELLTWLSSVRLSVTSVLMLNSAR